jgi:phosphohistidine phosphatase
MKTVYLLRHAKAKKDLPDVPDRERPLARRGREDAERMGRLFHRMGIHLDTVLSSPALRTRQTLELFLPPLSFPLESVEYLEELYPGSSQEILSLLCALKDSPTSIDREEAVLICGHNPAIEELASQWAGRSLDTFSTCGCFQATFSVQRWKELAHTAPSDFRYFELDSESV